MTTIKELKKMYLQNNVLQPKAKSSNNAILSLCDMLDDSQKIECEETKSGAVLNRGSVVECLIKLLFLNNKTAKKYVKGYDLHQNGKHYEIKFSTGFAYAHYDPKQDLSNLIFVNPYGVYLTSEKNIILDNSKKHIKDIKMNKDVKTLIEF